MASFFYFLAAVSILSAILVITAKNPIHSVLYLIICFFSIAGHYIILQAEFLAIVHIIVYAGAIMVLFLFVIMLLNLNKDTESHKPTLFKFAAVISGGALGLILIASLKISNSTKIIPNQETVNKMGSVKNLGKILFTDFLLPFELSSILFIAAMVGAVILAKKD